MDWEMPEMTGIEAVKVLKQNPDTHDIPVIIASGIRMSPENLEIALTSGATDFVRKPLEPVALIARVNSVISISGYIKQIQNQNVLINAYYIFKGKGELVIKFYPGEKGFKADFIHHSPNFTTEVVEEIHKAFSG
jgi:response regulator RpfG family c-di-GMP phosphodiesterase